MTNNTAANLAQLTIQQLRAYCKDNNIEVVGDRRKKQTFIDAIDAHLYSQVCDIDYEADYALVVNEDGEEDLVEVSSDNEVTVELCNYLPKFDSFMSYLDWLLNRLYHVSILPTSQCI